MFREKIFLIFFVYLLKCELVLGDVGYAARFSEDIEPCPDFENKHLFADNLKLGSDDDNQDSLGLSGFIDLQTAVEDGDKIKVTCSKHTAVGDEPVFKTEGDICSSLDDTNTPWYPLFHSCNITKCPIVPKIYDVENMKIDLGYASDVMCPEFVGTYTSTMIIEKDGTDISCYNVFIDLYEYEIKDEE